MYLVEDRLVESDFCFEAMEGLEMIPWSRCQRAVDETRQKIRENFKIKKRSPFSDTRIMMAALALIILGLGGFWIIHSNSNDTTDLTTEAREPVNFDNPAPLKEHSTPQKEAMADPQEGNEPQKVPAREPLEKLPPSEITTSRADAEKSVAGDLRHLAVGRIVDIGGQALQGVTVTALGISDRTDDNGYYALRLPAKSSILMLEYEGFSMEAKVDTSQNWEIVIDPEKHELVEQYPINVGNRFK